MSSTARGLMGWSRSSSRGSATSSASVVISRFSMTASRVSGKYTSMLGRSRCEGSATRMCCARRTRRHRTGRWASKPQLSVCSAEHTVWNWAICT